MNLNARRLGNSFVVTVDAPRIDAAVAIQFKDLIREATANAKGRVLLDLTQVQFVDSSGLGAIVAAKKQAPAGQTLELCGLSPSVQKVFALTRMDSVFSIYPSLASATSAQTG